MKNIPDSVSDFELIRNRNLAYIDKTRFIKEYEDLDTYVALLLRPRRFGKTMFTEILSYYYDKASQPVADKLFKGTWIADHPTELKNSYHVLKFDFSGIRTLDSVTDAINSFMEQIVAGIADFYTAYPELIIPELQSADIRNSVNAVITFYNDRTAFNSPAKIITHFLTGFIPSKNLLKLMIIIDEYDNFTNDILSRDLKMFADISRKDGEIGAFYNVLRNFNQRKVVQRIFITGVLPITMDTAVSGFVSAKLSDRPELSSLAGFTDDEVITLLRETVDRRKCHFSYEELKKVMKDRYDGYRFAKTCQEPVYNSALCLDFIRTLKNDYANIPVLEISSANDVDYTKLTGYLNLMKREDREALLSSLRKGAPVSCVLPVTIKLASPKAGLSKYQGISLLYHLGFLTLMSPAETECYFGKPMNGTFVKIANEYFKRLFERYSLAEMKIPADSIEGQVQLSEAARTNNLTQIVSLLKSVASSFVQTDIAAEAEYQLALAVYLAMKWNPDNSFILTREYYVRHNGIPVLADGALADSAMNQNSEEASGSAPVTVADTKKGRADLVAENTDPDGPSYVIEFKYKRNSRAARKTKISVRDKLFQEARTQLDFYVTDDHLKEIPHLHKYAILYVYGEFYLQEITD